MYFGGLLKSSERPTAIAQQRLDQIKQRYLYHRQYGHLLEGAVNFIVIAPLLEMAGKP